MTEGMARVVQGFAGARVLVVGDAMIDRFIHGEVARISPEAPIPVLAIRHEDAMAGGAGNVVRNLASLDGTVSLVSAAGDDAEGIELAGLLARDAPAARVKIVTEMGRITTVKQRFLAGSQQLLRADRETTTPVAETTVSAIAKAAEAWLSEAAVLVLSDYGKGLLPPSLLTRLIDAARARNVPVLVDPKGHDYAIYRGATLLSPNLSELVRACGGAPLPDTRAIVEAARELLAAHGFGWVLVTRGAEGMTLVGAETFHHIPTRARTVFDVSGAGDTVIATLALAFAAGASAEDAARLANVAAGIVVGKVGTATVRPDELLAALPGGNTVASGHVTPAEAAEQVARWRRQGLRVGFTNGCFDLLHQGHVTLLGACRTFCDRLVVAINSDASVARLKGPNRPLKQEAERAFILSALADVDLVVVFDEDTPVPLLHALRPDVLVKGGDYREDEVVGGDFVRSYGGEVRLAPYQDGFSTTATLARI